MDRRLAIVQSKVNNPRIDMSTSFTMDNGRATISSVFNTSWMDTNFSLPAENKPIVHSPVTTPWFDPNGLLAIGNQLPPFPSSISSWPFDPNDFSPIRAPVTFNQVGTRQPTPIYSTPIKNQVSIDPSHANGPHQFNGVRPTRDLKKVYVCSICYKAFPSPPSLAGHRSSHSKLKNVDKIAKMKLEKRLPIPPYKKSSSCNLALVNTPFGPIVTPGFGDGSSPTPHVSSVRNYLLGITDEKLKEATQPILIVKKDQFPIAKQELNSMYEILPNGKRSLNQDIKKGCPSKDGLFKKELPPKKKDIKEKRPRADKGGYMSDESVTSKRRPVAVAELDLLLRL